MQFISLLLYNISIRLYGFAIFVASFFNTKAKLWVEGRRNQQLPQPTGAESGRKRIWVHCASLGEFEQARPVIEKIKKSDPSAFLILTFFSPSGYEIRKNYAYADAVLYLPLDSANNARTFVNQLKPDLVLFVKYEFWHYYLLELKQRKIPAVLFSAIFRKEQVFFKWYGVFFQNMLRCFDKIFVQNKESHELLGAISIASQVSFDTRFDRVFEIAQNAKPFAAVERFKGNYRVLIAGSTWPKDEQLLTRLIYNRRNFKDYKFIIAPHNLNDAEINSLQKRLENDRLSPPVQVCRLSQLTADNAMVNDIILVDTMGDLSSLYRYGDIAYVGGGFNAGVHNVLEPTVYGLPVIFGPAYLKSAEAKELVSISSAFSITTEDELKNIVAKLASDETFMKTAATNAAQFVKHRLGGVDHVYNYIARYI